MRDEKRLRQLVDVFLGENKKLNLSAFRTEEHCWIGNVLDSLALLDWLKEKPKRFLDIGTGGGFPLLPLAVELQETECIGIDATQKKVDAVQRIADAMELQNCTLLCGRVEELAHQKGLRGTFDIVTARAVAPISVLLEYAMPFLRVGGTAVFWKSTKVADELGSSLNAQKKLHASFVETFEYTLPDDFGSRLLIVFRKNAETPPEFPRENGVPKARPL